ncbi:MAG: hypothetical protein QOC72_3170 [Methylobacteriaceae bacterium]|jgi:hypothetical protein|nr:hypothetical protein [Methylobacteriaceae bacterium]
MLRLLELFFFVASTGIWFAAKFQGSRTAHRIAGLISLVSFVLLIPSVWEFVRRFTAPFPGGVVDPAPAPQPADEVFWQAIKDQDVVTLFEEFIRKFPASSHVAQARGRIDMLRGVQNPPLPTQSERPPPASAPVASPTLPPDEAFWLSIRDTTAIALFEHFLRTFPKSKYAAEARSKADELKKRSETSAVPRPDDQKNVSISASEKLHSVVLANLKTVPVGNSIYPARIGKNFGELYASDLSPKALTVCIDWQLSRPDRFVGGAYANSNSSDERKSREDVIERSNRICERIKSQLGKQCECTLVELDGSNVLVVPGWWAKQWSSQ